MFFDELFLFLAKGREQRILSASGNHGKLRSKRGKNQDNSRVKRQP
jgi:hypothetical protein